MSKRKRVTQRKPRTTTSVVPYTLRDDARGIRVQASMLVYDGTLERPARNVQLAPIRYATMRDVKRVVNETLRVERERERYAVPPQLRPKPVTRVSPVRIEPYRPRVISTDAEGYKPKASWTRAELLRDVLLAARSA